MMSAINPVQRRKSLMRSLVFDGRVTMHTGRLGAKRNYPFYSAGGAAILRVEDTASPMLEHLAQAWPHEFNRALRHVGWRIQRDIKDSIYVGGVPGETWLPLTGFQQHRIFDQAEGRPVLPRPHHFGGLINAVAYRHNPDRMAVTIGWTSPHSASLAQLLQEGFTVQVSDKMRRKFAAAGRPLRKDRSTIRVPGRELIRPLFMAVKSEIPQWLEQRIQGHLRSTERSFTLPTGRGLGAWSRLA